MLNTEDIFTLTLHKLTFTQIVNVYVDMYIKL